MDEIQHYRAMEAFCRQRAKMEGEDESFWLAEARVLGRLIILAHRRDLRARAKKKTTRSPRAVQ
ncbi:MAG: hypothetical protein NVSMB6_24350 [Burkholderiaceae bacterium]